MAELPSELKSLTSIVARANELESLEPAVSYWARYWVVQKSMELQKTQRSSKVETYLLYVLDVLEAMKTKHAGMLELESFASGKAKVEAFALQIFDNADREEKARNATRNTSLKFLAAATFLEVCQVFGQPEKDLVDKRKYAKVQAMRIQSAIAAGKDPNTRRSSARAHPTDAAPTAEESAELDVLLSQSPSPLPSGSVTSPTIEEASVMDSGTNKLLTEHENITVSGAVDGNYFFPAEGDMGGLGVQAPDAQLGETIHAIEQKKLGTHPEAGPEESSTNPASRTINVPLDQDTIDSAQKHAKWAISALNYEDIATAISELRKALDCLANGA
ncbi:Putative uncharacterized protein [Taphrina deformans PYCC 5710]|uniref:Vacuolar protein sorting-associated protein VTA1 n=1 Tax=Taphrina deformans (strain PYCC 5710 / ATCC 11124 / CBS 356.35 / IMI 108563 / JCM 9778 / NBRC 8474) TaxID=1097556 RepID=R4X871_TAPDE|nr:Putative uncharacterized protein [Taphrina deformans PYCC 5710]|eukprot:CCG81698.1 Putative uncharacterized protein [Taphrina deformans PYCC 5710]